MVGSTTDCVELEGISLDCEAEVEFDEDIRVVFAEELMSLGRMLVSLAIPCLRTKFSSSYARKWG
jgi:hypothetical protein